jgi:hypothetical protein
MSSELHRWHRRSTVAIIVLSVVSSLVGLLRPGHYRAPADLVLSYQIQDLTILLVGVPVLSVGLWAASRGSTRGRLVWLGGMAFMTYIWASVAVQIPYNELFLVYVALFALSLFTFVGGIWSTDPAAIRRRLEGRVDPRLYAGALFVVGLGLATLWLSDVLPPLLQGTIPTIVEESGPQALTSHVLDLGVVVPSILLAAAWLYRRRTWGYVLAGVVLILGATLAAPIGLMTLVLLTGETVTVRPVAAFFTFLPIVVSTLLAVTYVRSMGRAGTAPGDSEGAQST